MKRFVPFIGFVLILYLSACHKHELPSSSAAAGDTRCTDTWTGARQFGSPTKSVYANASTTDVFCNLFLVGYTDGSLSGNSVTGLRDLFVIKYDNTGTLAWTRLLGVSSQVTYGEAVVADAEGAVYAVGFTSGDLDGQHLTGLQDLFIVKYNAAGEKQWTRLLGVSGGDALAYGATIDLEGSVYAVGQSDGTIDSHALIGAADVFVTKFSSSGVKQWTRTLGVAGASVYASGASSGPSNEIYISGFTSGGLAGNSQTGTNDAFLARYESDGQLSWLKQLGKSGKDTFSYAAATDLNGNTFIAGTTSGGLGGNTLTGLQDLFVAKYDSAGNRTWVKQIGASGAGIIVNSNSSAVDLDGNFFVSAETDVALPGQTLTGNLDLFIVKLAPTGSLEWIREIGTPTGNLYALGLSVNSSGSIFPVGYLDTAPLPGFSLTGSSDTYVLSYATDGTAK